jgi:hypothetical protein
MDVYVPAVGDGEGRRPNRWACSETDQPRREISLFCTVRNLMGGENAIICYGDEPHNTTQTVIF